MAAGLAAELKEAFGADARLIEGSGGIFQVVADGELVFDKKDVGRFPVLGEVSKAILDTRPEPA